MIDMALLAVDSNSFQSISSITETLMNQVFGNELMGGVMILGIGMYLMYRAGLSFTASVPLAFLLIFGLIYWTMASAIFRMLDAIIVFFVGIILAIVIIRHFFR